MIFLFLRFLRRGKSLHRKNCINKFNYLLTNLLFQNYQQVQHKHQSNYTENSGIENHDFLLTSGFLIPYLNVSSSNNVNVNILIGTSLTTFFLDLCFISGHK